MRQPTPKILLAATLEGSLLNFRLPLIQSLLAKGWAVSTLAAEADALDQVTPQDVAKELAQHGVEHHRVAMQRTGTNPLADLRTAYHIWKLQKHIAPDILVAYTAKAVIYGLVAAWICRVPRRVALITGLIHGMGAPPARPSLSFRMARLLARFALRRAHLVICQNPDDAESLRAGGFVRPETPVELVKGSGVDCDHFAQAPLPEGPCTFLMIARLLADKGVREYFDACRVVRAADPDCHFALAGPLDPRPGSITEAEIRAWEEDTHGKWHGSVSDVRPLLRDCHVYVLPSYHEGTPRTVLEAMATGRAILTTDAPGCRETVIPGLNGKLIPPKNAKALADAMGSLVGQQDRIQQMGSYSRKCVIQSFEAIAVAEATVAFILSKPTTTDDQ